MQELLLPSQGCTGIERLHGYNYRFSGEKAPSLPPGPPSYDHEKRMML